MLRARDVLPTASIDYELPGHLVAKRPVEPRDSSRLMVIRRSDPSRVEHRVFRDLVAYLRREDLLVVNRSSVVPARLRATRPSGGLVTGLYLSSESPGVWRVLLRASNRLREGEELVLGTVVQPSTGAAPRSLCLRLLRREGEVWRATLVDGGDGARASSDMEVLGAIGVTPLPPYILKARQDGGEEIADEQDRAWYQTVYAASDSPGSVAAPTAGLHFTRELLDRAERLGVKRAELCLHVGAGTFKPVQSEVVEDHPIHGERFSASPEACAAIRLTRATGGRVIVVGTTSARALESLGEAPGGGPAPTAEAETRLLITPGYRFRWTDGLVTNFHLPRSTLLALVSALLPEGAPRLLGYYREAIELGYRFYSYGDAMLVLP